MAVNTRILFTDLDGTLLNDNKEISEGNRAAVEEALAAGHKIVVSTGRALASGLQIAERVGLTGEGCYVIAFNGGQIYDPYHKKTIHGVTFPRDTAVEIFEKAAERNLYMQAYSDEAILTIENSELLREYAKIQNLPYKLVKSAKDAIIQDPYKLLAIDKDRSRSEKFQEEVLEGYSDTVRSFFSNDTYLEIVPKTVSKGEAVRWMCDYLGIPIENSVAAGDAQNDIEMLKAAHVGAVMCNAFPGIQEYGDYVTENDNNHDGVAEIIRKFIL